MQSFIHEREVVSCNGWPELDGGWEMRNVGVVHSKDRQSCIPLPSGVRVKMGFVVYSINYGLSSSGFSTYGLNSYGLDNG